MPRYGQPRPAPSKTHRTTAICTPHTSDFFRASVTNKAVPPKLGIRSRITDGSEIGPLRRFCMHCGLPRPPGRGPSTLTDPPHGLPIATGSPRLLATRAPLSGTMQIVHYVPRGAEIRYLGCALRDGDARRSHMAAGEAGPRRFRRLRSRDQAHAAGRRPWRPSGVTR